jgi:hypothetical protein
VVMHNSGVCISQEFAQFRSLCGQSDGCRPLGPLLSLQPHDFLNNDLAGVWLTPELRATRRRFLNCGVPPGRSVLSYGDPQAQSPELGRNLAGRSTPTVRFRPVRPPVFGSITGLRLDHRSSARSPLFGSITGLRLDHQSTAAVQARGCAIR